MFYEVTCSYGENPPNKCAVWTKLVCLHGRFSSRISIIYLELEWTTPVFLYLRIALRSPQIFCQSSRINDFHTVFLLDSTDVLTCETYGTSFPTKSRKIQLYFSQFGLFFPHICDLTSPISDFFSELNGNSSIVFLRIVLYSFLI